MNTRNAMKASAPRTAISLLIVSLLFGSTGAQDVDERPLWQHMFSDAWPHPPTLYWIGVRCTSSEGKPVTVREVIRQAPADRAGIRAGDQILSADGKELDSVQALAQAVQESQREALTLRIRRDGNELDVQVIPKRSPWVDFTLPAGTRTKELAEWIQQQAKKGIGPGINMRLVNPGIIFESRPSRFPEDTRMIIQSQGSEPVAIEIQQGEKRWKVTAESLAELPKDLQHWGRLLLNVTGSGSSWGAVTSDLPLFLPLPNETSGGRPKPARADRAAETKVQEDLRQRIDELSRQIELLRGEIDAAETSSEPVTDGDENEDPIDNLD